MTRLPSVEGSGAPAPAAAPSSRREDQRDFVAQAGELLFLADESSTPFYSNQTNPHAINNLRRYLPECLTADGRIDLKKLYGYWEEITGDEEMTDEAFDALFGNQDNELGEDDVITQEQFLSRLARHRLEFSMRGDFTEFRTSHNITPTSCPMAGRMGNVNRLLRGRILATSTRTGRPNYFAEQEKMWKQAREYVRRHYWAFGLKRSDFTGSEGASSEVFADVLISQFVSALKTQERKDHPGFGLPPDLSLDGIDFDNPEVAERFADMVFRYHFGDDENASNRGLLPTRFELEELRRMSKSGRSGLAAIAPPIIPASIPRVKVALSVAGS